MVRRWLLIRLNRYKEASMLRRTMLTSVILASACFASPDISVSAAPAVGLAAIIGTFSCVTHDDGGGVWRFHSSNHAWGAWVRADTSFAPQNGQPADTASTFVGFDATAKRWNIISIDADGSYYTRYSSSRVFDGSHWSDGYPADGAKAVIRVRGNRQYTFELVTSVKNGHAETAETVCTRIVNG
jgi:hypothetical protein